MKPYVTGAVQELEAGKIGSAVRVKEDPDGGGYVIVDGLSIGPSFEPGTSWLGFHIVWTYPDADVYPLFIDAGLRYVGSGPTPNKYPSGNLPAALTRDATMPGFELPAIQISRRSNRRDAQTDSALHKVLRVLDFLRSR